MRTLIISSPRRIWLQVVRNICAAILAVAATGAFAQDQVTTIRNQFETYTKENPQEKLFLHTDKESYIAGELMWFRVYSVDAATNKPVDLSKIAYVEILDRDGNAVLQAKIGLKEGSGQGSFYLPVSLSSGLFQLRAYTNWMKNFSPDQFFKKPLTIINSLVKPTDIQTNDPESYDVQLFPEGGNLVEGIPGKVAFRAIDKNGTGVNFKGAIVNNANDTVAHFTPLKFGIGSFTITPAANTAYKYVVTFPGGDKIIKDLPNIRKSGFVMHASEAGSTLKVKVESNIKTDETVYLFVHARSETSVAKAATLVNGKAEFLIDKASLGSGISHLTIFNSLKQPVAERLYFKRPTEKLVINAKPSQKEFSSRKQVEIAVDLQDERGKELPGDLSISVFPAVDQDGEGTNIFSYLWLDSELKGVVESPAYYFNNSDSLANTALDNLMLTHGWRRFNWEMVFQGKKPAFKYIPEMEGHVITGKLLDSRTGAPVSGIVSYLAVPGKKVQLYGSVSSENGDVSYNTRDLYGPGDIVVQTNYIRDSTYRVEIKSPFLEKQEPASSLFKFSLTPSLREQILRQSIATQVQNVYAGNKLRTFYAPQTDSTAFYLKPDKVYMLDNYVRFKTMEEVVREYVTELSITKENKNFLLWTPYQPHYTMPARNVEPLLLMDGVPVFERGNKIIAYDPLKVQKLEMLSQRYFLGPLIFDAVASFTTYKGNLPDFPIDPKATVMDYEGMQLAREFYSPVYDTEAKLASRIPDMRNVLYWSSNVKIDASGKKKISFYTSDQDNKYRVLIQGINPSGRAGASTFTIDVKN